MKATSFVAAAFLAAPGSCANAQEVNQPGAENPRIASTKPQPGDLLFRTKDGEYLKIDDSNYAVIVENVTDATTFGRMQSSDKTYYIANSGKSAGYYLANSSLGYIGTYYWTNAVAWTQNPQTLCLTVDGTTWKTYEYAKGNIKYAVIGDYNYTEKCFLPVPATESYQPIKLHSKYVNENAACVWQDRAKCPPFVVYYTESQSATLALSVRGGKLYQQNSLFDTTRADSSHSLEHTSIFVMDLHGVIYASNQNKVYMFHHSSILAGRDVAFAGEMQVEQGIIKKITNCSGHYRPDIKFAKQLTDSLTQQGYAQRVSVDSCNPVFYGLDYEELPVKAE